MGDLAEGRWRHCTSHRKRGISKKTRSQVATIASSVPESQSSDLVTQFSRESVSGKMCSAAAADISNAIKGCENLSHWISRLKATEAILKSSRDRDLRREVLVLHAAQKAQEQRWLQLKAKELEKCAQCAAFKRFCSCPLSFEDTEESKKMDEFFECLNSNRRSKRRQPSIL